MQEPKNQTPKRFDEDKTYQLADDRKIQIIALSPRFSLQILQQEVVHCLHSGHPGWAEGKMITLRLQQKSNPSAANPESQSATFSPFLALLMFQRLTHFWGTYLAHILRILWGVRWGGVGCFLAKGVMTSVLDLYLYDFASKNNNLPTLTN